jgi:hypothetical protein
MNDSSSVNPTPTPTHFFSFSTTTTTTTPTPSTYYSSGSLDSSSYELNYTAPSDFIDNENISPWSATALGLESALLMAVVIYLLLRRWVSAKTVRWYSIILVILGWFMSFYIIFLIPMDMSAVLLF